MEGEKKFYLRQQGLKKIKKEYNALKKLRLLKGKGEFPPVQESEDLNPDYLSLQEDLNLMEARILELENILKNVALIKAPAKEKQNVVDLGATVVVAVDGQKDEFELVGTLEANPGLGRISNESLVGKALMGCKRGDEVLVQSTVKIRYKILKISYK